MGDNREKQLERIRALLAKADRTQYPAEAESLYAKAQELITRFAVEDAELEGARATAENPIEKIEIRVHTPYPQERCVILTEVAFANDCRTVVTSEIGAWPVTVVGFRRDLERVELLYTSLALHAAQQMKRADKQGESPQRFYRSFLIAFGVRLGERLREAREEALRDHGGLLPVLADRSQLVTDELFGMFPRLQRGKRVVARSGVGWSAGKRSASDADLGQDRLAGRREAIR